MNKQKVLLLTTFLIISGAFNFVIAAEKDKDSRFEVGFDYISEVQSNMKKVNWAHQLHIDLRAKITDNLYLKARTLSVGKTRDKEILPNDLQVFSNLIEANLLLSLYLGGLDWLIDEHNNVFVGVHNMNDEFFASEVTSLFTNASCGIFPTLSSNFTAANFPYSSLGIQYKYDSEDLSFVGSIYNGQGYNRFSGRENSFRFCPKSDGVHFLSQFEFKHNDSHYFVGGAMNYGTLYDFVERKARTAAWTYLEQKLAPSVYLIADYSRTFFSDSFCKEFMGIGTKVDVESSGSNVFEFGLFSDYARFDGNKEFATELTCKYSFSDHFFLQPSLHFMHNDLSSNLIGLIRFGMEF